MADATTTATTATTATAAATSATTATPWYEGKATPEIIGFWQNKNYNLTDPITVAIESGKAAAELQRHYGVPPERLIKLPEGNDAAQWKAVWQRLGVPAEAKDYDFTGVKNAAGEPIDGKLADTLRAELFARNVPKDAATEIAKAMVKHQDGISAEQSALQAGKTAEEKAKLATSWKGKEDINLLQARVGAERLGFAPEDVAAMEKQVGYAKTMEAFRRVGALSAEDSFVEGGGGSGSPATAEGAQARLSQLTTDPAWGKRLLSGDPGARAEFDQLSRQITGVMERAA